MNQPRTTNWHGVGLVIVAIIVAALLALFLFGCAAPPRWDCAACDKSLYTNEAVVAVAGVGNYHASCFIERRVVEVRPEVAARFMGNYSETPNGSDQGATE